MKNSPVLSRLLVLCACAAILAGCLYNQHMRRGDMYFNNRSYQSAIVEYKAALQERPGSNEARRKLRQAEQVYFGQLHSEVDEELAAGDYEAAIDRANSALNVNAADQGAQDMVDRVATAVLEHTRELADARRFSQASWLLEYAADSLQPAREELLQQRTDVRADWIDWARASARGHEDNGNTAAAALYWAEAADVSGDTSMAKRAKTLAAQVRQEHRFLVSLIGDPSPKSNVIVNRISGPPVGMSATFFKVQKPGAHVARVGTDQPRFNTQTRARMESVQYVSGTRTRPNPRYQELSDDLRHARHRLHVIEDDMRKARRRYDYSGAEYDRQRYNDLVDQFNKQSRYVTDLRNELDRTPMEHEEEIVDTHNYQVETRTRTASLRVSVRVFDAEQNIVTEAAREPMTSASDESHSAQPVANIPRDPLELPSDQQMLDELYTESANVVIQVVEEAFESHRSNLMAATREKSGSLEAAATYVLLYPHSASATVVEQLAADSGVRKPDELLASTI